MLWCVEWAGGGDRGDGGDRAELQGQGEEHLRLLAGVEQLGHTVAGSGVYLVAQSVHFLQPGKAFVSVFTVC